jgi:hypothetical protein
MLLGENMRNLIWRFALILLFVLAACRREEEQEPLPTLAPTAVIPTTTAATTDEPEATAVPEVIQPETAPEPIAAIDPADIDWPPQLLFSSPAPRRRSLA